MADSKISELPVATTVAVTDILPIVSSGATKSITVGTLSLNLPNIGNKGITKNVVTPVTVQAIPLTYTIVTIPESLLPYTLANGTTGQELVIISEGTNTVDATTISIDMVTDSVVTLIFTGTKWVVKSFA
jgi:hypothetical protein